MIIIMRLCFSPGHDTDSVTRTLSGRFGEITLRTAGAGWALSFIPGVPLQ
jgi:hypothetical protein